MRFQYYQNGCYLVICSCDADTRGQRLSVLLVSGILKIYLPSVTPGFCRFEVAGPGWQSPEPHGTTPRGRCHFKVRTARNFPTWHGGRVEVQTFAFLAKFQKQFTSAGTALVHLRV